MTDYPSDVLERLDTLPCRPCVRWSRERRVAGIEDYLFIGGDRLSARAAAERIGVSERTVTRWRAALRSALADVHVPAAYHDAIVGQLLPAPPPVHLLTVTLSLACGHDGHDLCSSVLAEVTCGPCKEATPC